MVIRVPNGMPSIRTLSPSIVQRWSATVRAVDDCRVLALSRSFFRRLVKKNPNDAHVLLFNLGRIMAERLASATDSLASATEPRAPDPAAGPVDASSDPSA